MVGRQSTLGAAERAKLILSDELNCHRVDCIAKKYLVIQFTSGANPEVFFRHLAREARY